MRPPMIMPPLSSVQLSFQINFDKDSLSERLASLRRCASLRELVARDISQFPQAGPALTTGVCDLGSLVNPGALIATFYPTLLFVHFLSPRRPASRSPRFVGRLHQGRAPDGAGHAPLMIGQELVIRIIVVTSQAPGVWPALFVARPRPILLPAPPPHRSRKLMNERRASLGNGSPLSPSADGRAIRRREAACDDETARHGRRGTEGAVCAGRRE
jgi:hypothetical protein